MATATAPAARVASLTEADIRTAYRERAMPRYKPLARLENDLDEALIPFADPFRWLPSEDNESNELGAMLWSDLRPTEAEALHVVLYDALSRAKTRSLAIVEDEIVAACLAFVEAFPDAPRSRPRDGELA